MPYSLRCPGCGRAIPYGAEDAGKRGRCPSCGAEIVAPGGTADPEAATRALPASALPTREGETPPWARTRASERLERSGEGASPSSVLEPGLAQEIARAKSDPARRFGPFLILSELGKGGMGVVHRAWNERLRRVVALKRILAEGADAPAIQRFRREAEAAARLRHPGIVSVHEAGELDGQPYIAMDYIEGGSLDRRLDGKDGRPRLTLNRALEVVRDIARAVQYAHEQGVVHRDLKPQNVLLDARDRPFVMDFGLASVRGAGTKLTKTGMSMGTPAYMSPEQTSGEADERSDVYSLGATLYHVLAGHPPFAGSSDVNLVVAVLTKDPLPPSATNRRASGDLDTIVLKCLEKEPARRYGSAGELADDLERYLAGDPIAARPLGPLARLGRRARRNKLVTALAATAVALVLLLAANAAIALRDRARAETDKEAAVLRARETIVARAREEARSAKERLELERARTRKGEREAPEAKLARLRPLVALAIDSREAAGRLASLVPEDRSAAAGAYAANVALGEVALDAEQWELASSAFSRAASLGVDDARGRSALATVEKQRTALVAEHRRTVEETIASVGSSGYDHDDALFTLVRLGEPQTVEILARELDESTRRNKEALRELLLKAEVPLDDEARAGATRIVGLAAALDRYLAVAPGDPPPEDALATMELAGKRTLERDGRRRPRGEAPSLDAIMAEAQLEGLGRARIELTKLACEALGRIEIQPVAVDALLRYFWFEHDAQRATPAAAAICELGNEEAVRLVLIKARANASGNLANEVRRVLARKRASMDVPAVTAEDFCERGQLRTDLGDIEGALADFTRAIELAPADVRAWLGRGLARTARGQLPEAIADFTRVIELAPSTAGAWAARGSARSRAGDPKGAIADCNRALELRPDDPIALSYRGAARGKLHENEAAIADFTRAIELDPRSADAWSGRAGSNFELRRFDDAVSDATHAISLDPRKSSAFIARALSREAKGDTAGSLQDLDRAIEVDPENALAWGNRGQLWLERRSTDKAISDLSRAVELRPGYAKAWSRLGLAKIQKGDAEGATRDLTRALELDPGDLATLGNRANARKLGGDFAGALADLSRFIELAPRDVRGWVNRAVLRLDHRDYEEASKDATRAIELDPRYARAWGIRASARSGANDFDGALADASHAIELEPQAYAPWVFRGETRLRKRDVEGALADLTHAVELDPRSSEARRLLGDAHASRDEVTSALSDFDRALELDPRNTLALRGRGVLRERTGDKAGALADFRRLLELDPEGLASDSARKAIARLEGR